MGRGVHTSWRMTQIYIIREEKSSSYNYENEGDFLRRKGECRDFAAMRGGLTWENVCIYRTRKHGGVVREILTADGLHTLPWALHPFSSKDIF